jgi:endoglycosylceramidase
MVSVHALAALLGLLGCQPGPDRSAPADAGGCTSDSPGCVDWRYIVDDQGRALLLHGLNVDGDAKGDGLPSITRDEVLQLAGEYGMNHARYLIFWSRVEPEPGVYDAAYLDEVEQRLDWFSEAGIHVVLDMHQDCWGDAIYQQAAGDTEPHGANGAPLWATLTDGAPHTQPEGFWSLCYISADVMAAFDNFWDHEAHPELQDRYGAMWAEVAGRFAEHPAVLGYDLMNEPWEGSGVADQAAFDQTQYHAFLQRTVDALRIADPDGWVFYEPRAFGPNQAEPSWLPALEDPRAGEPRLAYYPHFYPVAYESGYDPDDDGYIARWQEHRIAEQQAHRTPMLVGEFSVLPFDSPADQATYFERMHTMLDHTTSGWAFWDRGLIHSAMEGSDQQVLDYLVRPFPHAVAGQPLEVSFDRATSTFRLVFASRARVQGPTEIFVPQATYPSGWTAQVGQGTQSWDEATGVLSVESDATVPEHTITITP